MNDILAMVWKEMTQIANRRRFAVERFALALAGAVMFVWAAYGMIYSREDSGYESLALFGRSFLIGSSAAFTYVLSAGAMLFASAVVVSEHLRRTLVFLLVTPLSAAAILGGKLASTCARVFSAVIVCLPLFALLTAFGGLDWVMATSSAGMLLSNVLLYASLGLMASATSRGFVSAIVRAVVYALLWQFFSLWIIAAGVFIFGRAGASTWLMSLNPVLATVGMARGMPFVVSYLAHFGINIGIAALCFLIAVRLFRRKAAELVTPMPKARRKKQEPRGPRARRWWARRVRLSGIADRFFGAGILTKELTSVELAPALMLPIVLAWLWCWVVAFAIADRVRTIADALFDTQGNLAFFGVEGTLLVIVLAGLATSRLASEHESGTFKTLGLTALGGLRILAGKAAAVLVAQSPAIALVLLHALWIVYIRAVPLVWAPVFILTVLFAFANAVVLGLYVSLPSRRIAHAAIAAVVLFASSLITSAVFAAVYAYYSETLYTYFAFQVVVSLVVVAALAAVLRFSATSGHTTALHVLSYLAVVGYAGVVTAFFSNTEAVLRASMPFSQASILYWGLAPRELLSVRIPVALLVLPGQLALAAWMSAMCILGFEAQLRRN